jgi:hypothetical protein
MQVQMRRRQIFEMPGRSLEDLLEMQASKNEVAGIQLFLNLPNLMIEDLTISIQKLREEEKNGPERDAKPAGPVAP